MKLSDIPPCVTKKSFSPHYCRKTSSIFLYFNQNFITVLQYIQKVVKFEDIQNFKNQSDRFTECGY